MPASRRAESVAARAARHLARLPRRDAASLRAIRRRLSEDVASESGGFVLAVSRALLGHGLEGANVVAYELLRHHPEAMGELDAHALEALGAPMRTWGDVDAFAYTLAGPAWRAGRIADEVVHRWARSDELRWRRAALVSSVPLNVKAQGGTGDAARTLAVCEILVGDRGDLVVKALSWALRALAVREPGAVEQFLREHRNELAPRILREVETKLATGVKRPKRTKAK